MGSNDFSRGVVHNTGTGQPASDIVCELQTQDSDRGGDSQQKERCNLVPAHRD